MKRFAWVEGKKGWNGMNLKRKIDSVCITFYIADNDMILHFMTYAGEFTSGICFFPPFFIEIIIGVILFFIFALLLTTQMLK